MTGKVYDLPGGIRIVNDSSLLHVRDIDGTIITDPPYNVGWSYDSYKDKMSEDEYYRMLTALFHNKKSVVIHYPEAMFKLAQYSGRIPDRVVPWVYPSNMRKCHRSIAWFGCEPDFNADGQDYKDPSDKRIKERMALGKKARLYDWWMFNQVKQNSKEKTEHPCQIPLALMVRILKVTKPEFVIEPFLGSGTTLLAASMLGIPGIGFDISEKYCEIAVDRIINERTLV